MILLQIPTESPIIGKKRVRDIVSITPQPPQDKRKENEGDVKQANGSSAKSDGNVASESGWNTVETGTTSSSNLLPQEVRLRFPVFVNT